MRHIIAGFALTLALAPTTMLGAQEQKQQFDIISYIQPGHTWKVEQKENLLSYTTTNPQTKDWCIIGLYRSTRSKGSIEADLKSEWNELVTKQFVLTDSMPASAAEEAEGWKISARAGVFTFNGSPASAILTTFSGHQVCTSILALTNTQVYLPDIEKLMASLELKAPDLSMAETVKPAKFTSSSPQKIAGSAKNFVFTTTNFDNGWVVQQKEDYVEMNRGNIQVLLHYGIAYNDEIRKDVTNACWNIQAATRYNVKQFYYPDNRNNYLPVYYLQADASRRADGKPVFITFLVLSENGVGTTIEVIAPNRQAYEKEFANLDAVAGMTSYNRFAVHARDIEGPWGSSGGSFAQYYNVYSGQYAGMNAVSKYDKFDLRGNQYTELHKGAMGFVGSQNVYQQEYKGSFTVTDWQLNTRSSGGEEKTYSAWYQAVRGGRLLHLQDKKYVGMHYILALEK